MKWNSKIEVKSNGFELKDGILTYNNKKIEDIEKTLHEMDCKEIKNLYGFLRAYKFFVIDFNKKKIEVETMLESSSLFELKTDWKILSNLRAKKASDIKRKTVDTLKKLDVALAKHGIWEWMYIATIDFYDYGNLDEKYDERVSFLWDKDKGFYFKAEMRLDEDGDGCYLWKEVEELNYLDFGKYKNLEIEKITNKMAIKIAERLADRVLELKESYIENLKEKDRILYSLNSLKVD